jgi:hypothetical protein
MAKAAAAERSIYEYDPRIPPRREVEKKILNRVNAQRGTYGVTRWAEQWILTCTCLELRVTCDMSAADAWPARHAKCRVREGQAELCKQGKHVMTFDKIARVWHCNFCPAVR